MPRMILTDEEARLVADFRHKNAVRRAHNDAIEACRALLRKFAESQPVSGQLVFSDIDMKLQELKTDANNQS